MCGIAGFVWGTECDATAVGEGMVRRLHHRGPDARGHSPLPGGRGVFAHTRLKIIDLSERAAQPFVSRDGRTILTFNGEIYNFRDLRADLERRGVAFRSSSDTEVILELYRARGLTALSELDGMFAFALFDADADRLVLMRDRFGKKPLYWSRTPSGALLFASEPKAFSAYPGFDLELDERRLPEYLTYGYVSTPHSFLKGVSKLPPASRLVATRGGEAIETYWTLPWPAEDRSRRRRLSLEETKVAVRDAIGRAVEKRMVADVPIGAFLSGGIDSSVVVLEMAKRSPSKVRTYAVGFKDDKSFDETPYAREVARRIGADHTEIVVEYSPTDLLETLLDHHDEPYGDSSALAVYAVARATKQHVSVVLTGDGGDELFAGYTRFLGALLSSAVPPLSAKVLNRLLRRVPTPRSYKNPVSLLQRFVEHGDRTADEQVLAWNSYFAGDRLRSLLRKDVYGDLRPWDVMRGQAAILESARLQGSDRLDQILRHNLATYLLDDLLIKVDRMTMAVALEARSPFLDRDLAELCFRIPSGYKVHRGRLKWILREAYEGLLPATVLHRKKHGFGVPVGRWWSAQLRDMVDDLLLAPGARSAELLEPARVRELVAEHRAGTKDHAQRIFALLQLELFLRRSSRARADRTQPGPTPIQPPIAQFSA